MPDGHRVPERGQVVRGDRSGHLVGVHRLDPQAEPGEPQRVAADAAAEVGHPRQAGVAEPAGMLCRDGESGGLLEAGAGEQHPVGERAELAAGAHPEARLRDDRRHEFGGVPRLSQLRDGARDVCGRVDGVQTVQQAQSLGREQRGQLGQVHRPSLRSSRPQRV